MSDLRKRFAALFGVAAVALPVAGCGDDNKSDDTSSSGGDSSTTTTASDPLSGIDPPSGSKQLNSSDSDGNYFARYSTSDSASDVIDSYQSQFESAGWTIVNSGGGGGGWGPWGGSGEGLTAQNGDTYADVQAGGAKGGTTYFEVCAGSGDRANCGDQSEQANTSSGGSQGNDNQNNNQTNSGGS